MTSLRTRLAIAPAAALLAGLHRRPSLAPGISAIVVKELRGRMRGRRAFAILTIYLVLLACFGWMLQRMNEEAFNLSNCFGCGNTASFASASIGRGVFIGLMMLQALIVAVLAPASTAVAISGERERQTLDLLAVTPISSLAIVLGKLLSALAWVFVLVLASIPITALVFVFGGVAPEDVLRGYAILFASVVGFGSIGLFFSAVLRRTAASTGITYVTALLLVAGSIFLWNFLGLTAQRSSIGTATRPPQALLYLNPFIAQSDVACSTEGGFGPWCNLIGTVTGSGTGFTPGTLPIPGFGNDGHYYPQTLGGVREEMIRMPMDGAGGRGFDAFAPQPVPDGAFVLRDRFWPRSVFSFLGLSVLLTLASVQFVSPTRRWRLAGSPPVRLVARPARFAGKLLRPLARPLQAAGRGPGAVARHLRRRGPRRDEASS